MRVSSKFYNQGNLLFSLVYSYNLHVFIFSENETFFFAIDIAGVFDLPFSTRIFLIESYVKSVVFDVSDLCVNISIITFLS